MRHFWRIAVPTYFGRQYLLAAIACCGFLVAGAAGSQAYEVNGAIAPLGVYAHVDLADAIQRYMHKNYPNSTVEPCSIVPQNIVPNLQAYLVTLYGDLLTNPAISGITLGIHWCAIQVCAPNSTSKECKPFTSTNGYDWSYLDNALSTVATYNSKASYKKNVQLLITPGFDTPSWVLDPIPSCDGLFQTIPKSVKPDCGKVSFSYFPEQNHADGNELPLPWSSTYVSSWFSFLQDLYQETQMPANQSAFAAIAIAGPVGASTEMILPTTALGSYYEAGGTYWMADDMWLKLIDHAIAGGAMQNPQISWMFPNYKSYKPYYDQLFVDSWNSTIQQFQQIFSGVTLILTADSGINDLPQLGFAPETEISQFLAADSYNIYQALWPLDCGSIPQSASCQAKVEILSYFVTSQTPPAQPVPNLKATDVGGMTASSSPLPGNIGVPGAKVLTSWPFTSPSPPPPPSPSILGGAEFDFPVTQNRTRKIEGCPSGEPDCHITPVEAAYNVFTYFFNCTAAGSNTSGTSNFTFVTPCASTLPKMAVAPIQFVDVDYVDVEYANKTEHNCPLRPANLNGKAVCTSLQDLLNQASYALLTTANPNQPAQSITPTCQNTPPNCQ